MQWLLRCMCCVLLTTFASIAARSQTLESVTFATTQPLPVANVPAELAPVRAMIERASSRMRESQLLISTVRLGQKQFGLTPSQVATLTGAFADVYAKIEADPLFAGVPSALGDAMSNDEHRPGHYFLYRPATVDERTPAIIFLHGFGGNFQFYTWLLKEEFPGHVIVAPSYGIAWSSQGVAYLDDVTADVQRRLKIKLARPWLMAISAGGPAGFAVYQRRPEAFRGFVCIASAPTTEQVRQLVPRLNVLMINGVRDERFPIDRVRAAANELSLRLPRFRYQELPDDDHFFLLTDRARVFERIKEFVMQPAH